MRVYRDKILIGKARMRLVAACFRAAQAQLAYDAQHDEDDIERWWSLSICIEQAEVSFEAKYYALDYLASLGVCRIDECFKRDAPHEPYGVIGTDRQHAKFMVLEYLACMAEYRHE